MVLGFAAIDAKMIGTAADKLCTAIERRIQRGQNAG
jgi:hypothetical protein